MKRLEYWQQKLVQLLHDPPGKAFFIRAGAGGHKSVSADLFEVTAGVPLKFVRREADMAAAGADRPVCSPPSRQKGIRTISVDWVKHPILTHPLASGNQHATAIDLGSQGRPSTRQETRELADTLQRMAAAFPEAREAPEDNDDLPPPDQQDDPATEQRSKELAQLAALPRWQDEAWLQQTCWKLWRRMPEEPPPGVPRVLWHHQPAESRTPDHSLWDHLRVTSSLAFLTGRKHEGPAMPWLLSFSIGPVQRFIAQSRTSRDLWTTSMLLSDLVWHAMVPFVEQHGPEAIVYPDLRRNPRADQWLWEKANGQEPDARYQDVLPERRHPDSTEKLNPCAHAGIFPNTFMALVPQGREGSLERLQELAEAARKRVQDRWKELAQLSKDHFLAQARPRGISKSEEDAIHATWNRQHQNVLFTAWSAAAWPNIEPVKDPETLAIRESLPAQAPAPTLSPDDRKALDDWRARHVPWLPTEAFARYARARYVYARTNLPVHQSQRGFDYPLVHHALFTRAQVRKAEASGAMLTEERCEKCTLCGSREALGAAGHDVAIDSQREIVRDLWRRLDRNSDGGAERLCAVCTMKRFLIPAGIDKGSKPPRMVGLTAAWAGPATPLDEVRDDDEELRVPFPSTATVASQGYLSAVATHPKLRDEVAEVVRCCQAARLPRTSFVRSLRSLADAAKATNATGRLFLEYEAELMVYPDVLAAAEDKAPSEPPGAPRNQETAARGLRNQEGKPIFRSTIKALRRAVETLRQKARDLDGDVPAPGTQIALIALDGDSVREILLGTEIGAKWENVIHPLAVAEMKTNGVTQSAHWPSLLESARLMGPSTHAFVSRVLADFAHTIVPWVVEREFHGRLIYAGGDDVLALVPANEALGVCARLAQLYSAAWVLDTRPWEEPWDWRRKEQRAAVGPASTKAEERFVIVAPGLDGHPVSWPVPAELRRGSIVATEGAATEAASEKELLLPMMGPGQTLSAGIAIGHYKTPLGGLVKACWDERDRAKGKRDEDAEGEGLTKKNAFSIRRYTRGGEKARLRLSWGDPTAGSLRGYLQARHVIEGFSTGALPGRLPYKLREVEGAVFAVWRHDMAELRATGKADDKHAWDALHERVQQLAQGLFCTQGSSDATDAFEIWWQGLSGAFRAQERRWDDFGAVEEDLRARRAGSQGFGSEQGLAVCRFLGALARGEEDVR